jgi:ketosteroid isomerase-like protein
MSQENVEVARTAHEALIRGDLRTWSDSIDPEVEWDATAYPIPDQPQRGKGREDFARAVRHYAGSWPGYEATLADVFDGSGDQVVVVTHETIRPTGTEMPMERDLFQVVTVKRGRCSLIRFYRTRSEALEAAGLSE